MADEAGRRTCYGGPATRDQPERLVATNRHAPAPSGFDPQTAAAELMEARRTRRLLDTRGRGPGGVEQAYEVQEAVARELGPIAGWKVGAKAPGDTPLAAPLFSSLVRPSPATFAPGSFHMIGIEAEVAFKLGTAVPARAQPLAPAEVFAHVASVHAAIEIVDTRLADWSNADRLWALADNQTNGAFVYDPAGVPWRDADYTDAQVRLEINGEVVVERAGGNPAGDPRPLLVWLVNHCATQRGGLAAGTFVTTGSYTGMIFIEPGATVTATFPGLGSAQVRLD
jgi:2-keto-4-pentenoate hydratase